MEVADVEAADAAGGDLVVADVAVVAADPLVAARAERVVAGTSEDDRADLEVVAGPVEGVAELAQGRRPERVVDVGAVDRNPGDAVGGLVDGCLRSLAGVVPLDRRVEVLLSGGASLWRLGIAGDRVRAEGDEARQLAGPALGDVPRADRGDRRRRNDHLRGARAARGLNAREAWPASASAQGSNVALELEPGPTFAVALHALMKLGAVACPLNTRAPEDERKRVARALRPALRDNRRARPRTDRGGLSAARRDRPRRRPLPDPDQRDLRPGPNGRPDLRQPPLERRRLRLQPRRQPRRPLALLPAGLPRLRPLDPVALGDLRDGSGDPQRLRPRAHRPLASRRRRHA